MLFGSAFLMKVIDALPDAGVATAVGVLVAATGVLVAVAAIGVLVAVAATGVLVAARTQPIFK